MRARKYDWKKDSESGEGDNGTYRLAGHDGVEAIVRYRGNGHPESVDIEMKFPGAEPIRQVYDATRDQIVGPLNDVQNAFLLSQHTDVDAIGAAIRYKGAGKLPTSVRGAALALLSKLPEALGHE